MADDRLGSDSWEWYAHEHEEAQQPVRRHPQRPLDDFEVRRLPNGDMEVVFCGSRYDTELPR